MNELVKLPDAAPCGKERNHGVDLLRMVAMYGITLLHVIGFSGFFGGDGGTPAKRAITWGLYVAVFCSVNCFALISGFVGVAAKFRFYNLFRLWLQALFYSVPVTLAFYFFCPGSVEVGGVLRSFLPITTGEYWYLTAYALMFFFIPQMNFILQRQKKHQVRILLWIFFLLFSVASQVPVVSAITEPVKSGYSALWLGYLYFIGGFIRQYGVDELFPLASDSKVKRFLLGCRILAWRGQWMRFSVYLLCVVVTFFDHKQLIYNSPAMLIAGIALLDLFFHWRIRHGIALIGFAARLAFGVYLIQNQTQIWNFFMQKAFVNYVQLPTGAFIAAVITTTLAIYVAGSLIDQCRLMLFHRWKIR